jgi:hypothetical protein
MLFSTDLIALFQKSFKGAMLERIRTSISLLSTMLSRLIAASYTSTSNEKYR